MEGLVPDLGETVGRAGALADLGVEEVEQEQAREPLRRHPREWLHHAAAHVVTDNADLLDLQPVEQRQHVRGHVLVAPRASRLVAGAEAAQVGCDQREAIGEPLHHQLPRPPELRPAVEQ